MSKTLHFAIDSKEEASELEQLRKYDVEQHHTILSEIMRRLIKYRLKLKIGKSKFFQKQVTYLGYVITSEGLKADPKKSECINKFPRPKTVKEVQSM